MQKLGLEQIQELMRRYLEQDRENKFLELEGGSIDEVLKAAAIELDVPVARLEFMTLQEGADGFFGIGRKPWRLKVSAVAKKEDSGAFAQEDEDLQHAMEAVEVKPVDKDGAVYVHLSMDGALIKVTPPVGKGKYATEKMAIDRLHGRAVRNFDQEMVAMVVKQASSDYVRVGEFISNPTNDSLLSVDIQDQDMEAYVTVLPPGPGGCDLSYDAVIALLRNNRIISGILEEAVHEVEDNPCYKTPILVAQGQKPVNGRDAYIQYNFETEQSKVRLKETSSGQVDFKELNLIQNVVAGQPLARKVPPEKGINGKTVTGKLLGAKNGKDVPMPLGKNVHVAPDGVTIVSDMNGQVMISSGKINVEEILTIQGDVSLKTGNIMFLGTVIIKGNVEDGYQVKAAGNIEVTGSVGKATIDAEGDIFVHQGIAAKSGGYFHAGKSIWARFIENAKVEAEEYVVVSDGIINSEVDSNKKIVCQGKRASIVGGHLRAAEEINAKALGSAVGGSETILEAGVDPKSKVKMEQITSQHDILLKQIDELDKNIMTLNQMKKLKKELPPEKEALLEQNLERKAELDSTSNELAREIETLQNYMNQLKARGKICASGKVFPGVHIIIREVEHVVKNEMKGVTFFLENNMVRTAKYEEVDDEDIKRGPPDAYKAD